MFPRLCLHARAWFPECVVILVFCCKLCQVNAIKERAKAVSELENEITKYVDEGKDEYKEVAFLLHSDCLSLVEDFSDGVAVAAKRVGASRNPRSAARGRETEREGRQRDGKHPPGH